MEDRSESCSLDMESRLSGCHGHDIAQEVNDYLIKKTYKMRLILIGLILASLLSIMGCSNDPSDVKISELDTACEHVDAIIDVMQAAVDTKGEQELYDLSEKDREYIKKLGEKGQLIASSMEDKFTPKEYESCDHFESLDKLMSKNRGLFR
jgi:hypothetical protein